MAFHKSVSMKEEIFISKRKLKLRKNEYLDNSDNDDENYDIGTLSTSLKPQPLKFLQEYMILVTWLNHCLCWEV